MWNPKNIFQLSEAPHLRFSQPEASAGSMAFTAPWVEAERCCMLVSWSRKTAKCLCPAPFCWGQTHSLCSNMPSVVKKFDGNGPELSGKLKVNEQNSRKKQDGPSTALTSISARIICGPTHLTSSWKVQMINKFTGILFKLLTNFTLHFTYTPFLYYKAPKQGDEKIAPAGVWIGLWPRLGSWWICQWRRCPPPWRHGGPVESPRAGWFCPQSWGPPDANWQSGLPLISLIWSVTNLQFGQAKLVFDLFLKAAIVHLTVRRTQNWVTCHPELLVLGGQLQQISALDFGPRKGSSLGLPA